MTLFRAFLSVGVINFLSRLLGLWRDIVIAQLFGAGAVSDAFFAAFRLPNMLRRFTAEGALTQAFVPVYGEQRRAAPQQAALVAGETAVWLASVLLLLCVAAVIGAPYIIMLLAPGLTESALAADLFRIVVPYILFISLVALFAGMLTVVGRFYAAASASLLLNIGMLAAMLWWAPFFQMPIFALAWGVFFGGIAQLLWLIFHIRRAGLMPQLKARWRPSPAVRRIMGLLWKGAVGAGAAQINLLVNLVIASFLTAGSISWLYYADRLMELPVGLLGATMATVVLPGLAAQAGRDDSFNALLDMALRLLVLLALPAAVGLALMALPLTATLFMHGQFDETDARMTQQAVLAYSVGVFGLSAVRPLAAAFFARQDAAVPVKTAILTLFVTQILNVIFIAGLDLGHVGLALSVGLAACVNAAVLLTVLWRRGWYRPMPGWTRFFAQTLAALAAMALLLGFALPAADFWLTAPLGERIVYLLSFFSAAVLVYFAVAWMGGIRPAHFQRSLMK